MAKTIKRFGKTPIYGLERPEMTITDDGSTEEQILLATNINWQNSTKDYEQLGTRGGVIGYMLVDAQMDWSMTANVDVAYSDTFGNYIFPGSEMILSNDIGRRLLEAPQGLNYDPADAVSILKQVSISQSNDGPASFDLSGTVYYFSDDYTEPNA